MGRVLWLLLLSGCGWVGDTWYDEHVRDQDGDGGLAVRFGGDDCQDANGQVVTCDNDGDGFRAREAGGEDCDDARADVHPQAIERCDGIDNDCDGAIDNSDEDAVGDMPWFLDQDGDGFGDPDQVQACQVLADPTDPTSGIHSARDGDCDDSRADIHPLADEICDGLDNDCNGVFDDQGLWFEDLDGDGFGTARQVSGDCELEPGDLLAPVSGDCDDEDPNIAPNAPEVRYDGVDQNCNGAQDDWDGDFDGHVPSEHYAAAQAVNGALPIDEQWVIEEGDCDDENPARFFGNPEVCDGFDNDCDQLVDHEDLTAGALEPTLQSQVIEVYIDVDGDGFFGVPLFICPVSLDPTLHSTTQDDCYEGEPLDPAYGAIRPNAVNAGADEVCDGVDNDCDGQADWHDLPFNGSALFFRDIDGDGYGVTPVQACGVDPAHHIAALPDDCNDSESTIHPNAIELCGDSVRQDCTTASIWDCDGDGVEGFYGTGQGTGDDCDDTRELIFPSTAPGAEICDGLDNDCDGLIDSADLDNLDSTQPDWFVDGDGDGYAADGAPALVQCDQPAGYVLETGDCDDQDPTLSPDTLWYRDADGDLFGELTSGTATCVAPGPEWVLDGQDCNDVEAAFNPDTRWLLDQDGDFVGDPLTVTSFCLPPAGEPWVLESVGIDCDDNDPMIQGTGTWYRDLDNDNIGDIAFTAAACVQPTIDGVRYVNRPGDCNDNDPTINPDREELCNALDDDCDGLTDDDDPSLRAPLSGPLGWRDDDGDGVGGTTPKTFCFAVPALGWSPASGDCDDADPDVFPGQLEVCGNGIDDDCDGSQAEPSWFVDDDGDGFGVGTGTAPQCDPPSPQGYASVAGDCDDTEPLTYPGAEERDSCDTIDDDCDGTPEPRLTWYFDQDGDGFGDDTTAFATCFPPSDPPSPGQQGDWVLEGGDCDDDDPSITFGRIWYLDRDGDGLGDDASTRFACSQFDPQGQELTSWLFDDVNGDGLFDAGDGLLSVFAGDCNDTNAAIGLTRIYYPDVDLDSWGANNGQLACEDDLGGPPPGLVERSGDCDDSDNTVSPSATELDNDGIDSNCDGLDDNDTGISWFPDADADGFGDRNVAGVTSYAPGMVNNNADCDDSDAGVSNGIFVFVDSDLDTYGTGNPLFVGRCTLQAGEALVSTDCDDSDSAVNPGAIVDLCDGVDNDCTGLSAGEEDFDGDGFLACINDCNDLSATFHLGAPEICDGVEMNGCADVFIDPDVDLDGDGFTSCEGDPDDTNASIAPGLAWFVDGDGDGFGDANHPGVYSTTPLPGRVINALDCDDADAGVHPVAAEICGDNIDNNCDNNIDDAGLLYVDNDNDAIGGSTLVLASCSSPSHTTTTGDCDDNNPNRLPGVSDVCDGVDNDCDSTIDEDATFVDYYADLDRDGQGGTTAISACNGAPTGTVQNSDDCNDLDPLVFLGAAERCNGLDDDCDDNAGPGESDSDGDGYLACEDPDDGDPNSVPGATEYFADGDGDGVGAGAVRYGLVHPGVGWSTLSGDCDDNDTAVSPNITVEYCDGKDNNCDGAELWGPAGLVTVDVSSVGGTVNGALSTFAHSSPNGVFTFEGAVQSCVFAPMANELRIGSNSIPLQVVSAPLDQLVSAYPTCIDGSSASYWYPDADEDGVPLASAYRQVFVDCGLPPVGAEWAQLGASGEMDCDDTDASRFQIAHSGMFADMDGDGSHGVVSAVGQCVGTTTAIPGTDCDDTDPSTTTEGGSTIQISDQTTFDRVWSTCQVADLLVDATASLAFPGSNPPSMDFTVHASPSGLCSSATPASCIGGALSISTGDRLHLHDIDVHAVITTNGSVFIAENTVFFDSTIEATNTSFTIRSSAFENPTSATALTAATCEVDLHEVSFNGANAPNTPAIASTDSQITMDAFSITNWDIGIDSTADTLSGILSISDASTPLDLDFTTANITLTATRSGAIQQVNGSATCTDCVFNAALGYWDVMDNNSSSSLEMVRPTLFNDASPNGFRVIGPSSYLHLTGMMNAQFPNHRLVDIYAGIGLVEDITVAASGDLFLADNGTLTVQNSTFNSPIGPVVFQSQNQGSLIARNLTGESLALFATVNGTIELSDSSLAGVDGFADSGTLRLERVRTQSWNGVANQGGHVIVDGSLLFGGFTADLGSQIQVRNTTVLASNSPLLVDQGSIITVSESMFDQGFGCVMGGTGQVDWQDSWITMADQINTAPNAPCFGLALTATGNNLSEVDTGPSDLFLPEFRENNPLIAARFGELSY